MTLPSNMVQAGYREPRIGAYRGNPLIEALPRDFEQGAD